MIISIPRERRNGETRVAATPETVRRYVSLGFAVRVEQNAGRLSGFPDETYRQAGAEIVADTAALWKGAGLILKIWAPQPEEDRKNKQRHGVRDYRNVVKRVGQRR